MAKTATLATVGARAHYSQSNLTSNFNALNNNFANFLHLNGVGESGNTMLNNFDMGGKRVINVAAASASFDLATKAYVDQQFSDTAASTISLTVEVDLSDTSLVAVGGGVVGAPSLTRSADLDTGFWFPAANTIGVSGFGVEVMRMAVTTDLTDSVITSYGTLDASDKDTASFVVEGGMGIEKALFVGGLLNIAGVATLASSVVTGDLTAGSISAPGTIGGGTPGIATFTTVDGIIGSVTPAAITGETITANTSMVVDTIAEKTAAAGVTIDSALIINGRAPFPLSYVAGGVPSAGSVATTDFDITACEVRSSANANNIIVGAVVDKDTSSWTEGLTSQGGLDTGSIGNDTYHAYAIGKTTDPTAGDILYSLSATFAGTTKPAGYDIGRRIFSFNTNGSNEIIATVSIETAGGGLATQLATPVQEFDETPPATTQQDNVLASVPTGIKVLVDLVTAITMSAGALDVLVDDSDLTIPLPTTNLRDIHAEGGALTSQIRNHVLCDTSAQIGYRSSATTNATVEQYVHGWIDSRR